MLETLNRRMKMKAIIVYQSGYGHVEQMAGKVKAGLETDNSEVRMTKASETDPADLIEYDIIILGSPVRMGSIGAEMKTFIDNTGGLWLRSALNDKVGGVIVSGGGFNSGLEMTQHALYSALMELGLVLIGFQVNMPGYGLGANQWGPYAKVGNDGKDGPTEHCLLACFEYGKRLAKIAKLIRAL